MKDTIKKKVNHKVQKQKQKQTVIVNINDKPKTRARRTTKKKADNTLQKNKLPSQPVIFHTSSPHPSSSITPQTNTENQLTKLLKEIMKEQQAKETAQATAQRTIERVRAPPPPNPRAEQAQHDAFLASIASSRPEPPPEAKKEEKASIERVRASRLVNLQREIIADTAEEDAVLHPRPPSSITEEDATIAQLRRRQGRTRSTDDALDALRQIALAQNQTPAHLQFFKQRMDHEERLHEYSEQARPNIGALPPLTLEESISGSAPVEEVDLFAEAQDQAEKESSKQDALDLQEFEDTLKARGASAPSQRNDILGPTPAEKAGFPVAESRFADEDAPEADAEPVVGQAEAKKVSLKTVPELALEGVSGMTQMRDLMNYWNTHNRDKSVKTTKSSGGYKNAPELIADLEKKGLSVADIKAYYDEHHTPAKAKLRPLTGARIGTSLDV